jgi:hypothetical protein
MKTKSKNMRVFETPPFAFSEEEIGAIKQALEYYRPDLIKEDVPDKIRQVFIGHFIYYTEDLCRFFKEWLSGAPKRATHRGDVQELTNELRQTLKRLKAIEENRFFAPRVWEVSALFNYGGLVNSMTAAKLQSLARQASSSIEEMINLLEHVTKEEEQKPVKKGKPPADFDTGLIRQLAELYRMQLFARPTSYIDGPFVLTVRTVLEILGLKSEDPSRSVKAALKNLP